MSKSLNYKGHPLRRKDNYIYYGSMEDKYIVMLKILETKQVKDLEVPSRVSVELQLTDASVRLRDKILNKSEKTSLYTALDLGAIWLERALSKDQESAQ